MIENVELNMNSPIKRKSEIRLALVEVALLWSCLATISNSSSFFNALMHDYLLVIRSNSNRIGISTTIPTKHTVAILTDEAENVNEIIILEVLCK